MKVGYMRTRRKPNKFVELLAKTTKYHGIDLVYFHPEDIDMEQKKIKGKIFTDHNWVTQDIAIPSFVDVTVYSFKYKKQIKFLRENSYFTTGKLANKEVSIRKLKEDGEFAHLLIPTINHTDFNQFLRFLKRYRQIIMKPTSGQRGDGVHMISKNGKKYTLCYGNKEETLTKRKLKKFINQKLSEKKYIYQKYIHSRTKFGDPFDCRIRLEKNGKGEWETVINLIRIGSGQKVVSNVAKGGSVSELDSFLKSNYGDKWKKLRSLLIL